MSFIRPEIFFKLHEGQPIQDLEKFLQQEGYTQNDLDWIEMYISKHDGARPVEITFRIITNKGDEVITRVNVIGPLLYKALLGDEG